MLTKHDDTRIHRGVRSDVTDNSDLEALLEKFKIIYRSSMYEKKPISPENSTDLISKVALCLSQGVSSTQETPLNFFIKVITKNYSDRIKLIFDQLSLIDPTQESADKIETYLVVLQDAQAIYTELKNVESAYQIIDKESITKLKGLIAELYLNIIITKDVFFFSSESHLFVALAEMGNGMDLDDNFNPMLGSIYYNLHDFLLSYGHEPDDEVMMVYNAYKKLTISFSNTDKTGDKNYMKIVDVCANLLDKCQNENRSAVFLIDGISFLKQTNQLIPADVYIEFMMSICNTDNPNFSFIWDCLDIIQKNKNIHRLDGYVFCTVKEVIARWFSLNKVERFNFDKPFIPTNLKLFSSAHLKQIIKQFDLNMNNGFSENEWALFLKVLILHKTLLFSTSVPKKMMGYSNKMLNDINENSNNFNYVFLLVSCFNHLSVLDVRNIHQEIRNKIGQVSFVSDEHILRMIEKSKTISADDLAYWLDNMDWIDRDQSIPKLFQLTAEKISEDDHQDFIVHHNKNSHILESKECFFTKENKLFLNRLFEVFSEDRINELSPDAEITHQEYQQYREFHQLKGRYQQEWINDSTLLPSSTKKALSFFFDSMDSLEAHKHYLPSEKNKRLKTLIAEVQELADSRKKSQDNPVKTKKKIAPMYVTKAVWEKLKRGSRLDLEQINDNLVVSPYVLESYLIKIKCLIKLGYVDQALENLFEAKKLFSKKSREFLLLEWASCCKKLGQYEAALEAYEQRLRLPNPPPLDSNIAYCLKLIGTPQSLDQSYHIYKKLIESATPETRVSFRLNLAQCLVAQARINEAEQEIRAIPDWDKNPEALAILGSISLDKQDHDKAIYWYKKSTDLKKDMRVMEQLLRVYQIKGWIKEAALMKGTIKEELMHSDYDLLRLNASVYLHSKRFNDALNILNQITDKWGKNERNYLDIGRCYRELKAFDKAIEHFRLFPDYHSNRKILAQLAMTYCAAGLQKEAQETYDRLFQTFPSYPYLYVKAIDYFISIHDHARIATYWEYCQKEFSEFEDVFRGLKLRVNAYYTRANLAHNISSDPDESGISSDSDWEEEDESVTLGDLDGDGRGLEEQYYPNLVDEIHSEQSNLAKDYRFFSTNEHVFFTTSAVGDLACVRKDPDNAGLLYLSHMNRHVNRQDVFFSKNKKSNNPQEGCVAELIAENGLG